MFQLLFAKIKRTTRPTPRTLTATIVKQLLVFINSQTKHSVRVPTPWERRGLFMLIWSHKSVVAHVRSFTTILLPVSFFPQDHEASTDCENRRILICHSTYTHKTDSLLCPFLFLFPHSNSQKISLLGSSPSRSKIN